jgi:hypothetical protein
MGSILKLMQSMYHTDANSFPPISIAFIWNHPEMQAIGPNSDPEI